MALRALLTEREREIINRDADVSDSRRYQTISRVRNKIHDELPKDLEILRESHPDLYNELREVVCDSK